MYDFSVDYDATDVDDIKNIHQHFMKKNDSIIKCLDLLKNVSSLDHYFYQTW